MASPEAYSLDAYKCVADLDSKHGVFLVQHIISKRIFVKKELTVFSKSVYDYIMAYPVSHMPRVIEAIEQDGRLTVIEEYVVGDTLQYCLDNAGPFEKKQAIDIVLQLCKIVEELHNATPTIVHRDIKPSNIILTSDGIVKLLDMNAAKQYVPNRNADTKMIGTVGFAAPEQYGFSQSSTQTDIYAIGVLLNMLLTGELPNIQLASGNIQSIICKCIEISPKDRYSTVAELYHELEKIYTTEYNMSAIEQPQKSWRYYLPPGLRSGQIPQSISAILGYSLMYWLAFTLKVENATSRNTVINRIAVAILFTSLVFFNGNYLNIHQELPITKSKNRFFQMIGVVLYNIAIVFCVLLMVAVATS